MSHITRGDRVALLTRNSIESMEILPAVATLGAISVPVNYRPAPRESEFILADSEMRRAGKESELETTVTRGSPERVNRDVRENDGCMIMYTSGTTGHPPLTGEDLQAWLRGNLAGVQDPGGPQTAAA